MRPSSGSAFTIAIYEFATHTGAVSGSAWERSIRDNFEMDHIQSVIQPIRKHSGLDPQV